MLKSGQKPTDSLYQCLAPAPLAAKVMVWRSGLLAVQSTGWLPELTAEAGARQVSLPMAVCVFRLHREALTIGKAMGLERWLRS